MLKSESSYSYIYENSYERFMKRHLQHYGFYQSSKLILQELEGYEKTHGYSQSDESISGSEKNQKFERKSEGSINLKTTQIVYDYFEDGSYIKKLKAPHNYVLNLQQPPRWPIEMQVIPEIIQHINVLPQNKELLYIQNGSEIKPQPKGEEGGRLIFDYNTYCGPFFTKSKSISTEIKDLRPVAVEPESEFDETLCFESRFESGNLEKVYKISAYDYELYLRPDIYTSKHTQWYYFRVSNTRANRMYRFTISNLYKSDSLYNEGLKPLMYSDKDARQSNKGWRRWGHNIAYYKNNLKYNTKKGDRNYYSLTWNCTLLHDKDTVYFSHCYPYTYSNLMKYIDCISKDSFQNKICRIKLLTRTLAENLSILLTITNPFSGDEAENQKKIIFITGRVHPGETNASWMVEGVLNFLLSDKPDASLLRDMFIFKIVPMLNPDGVIVGNYRCSLTGRDLNRNYKTQLKDFYPIIYTMRSLIDKLIKEKEILLYCDFHGHSKKQNIFIYGCNDQKDETEFLIERAFPFLLSKNASDKFDYESCRFNMQKSKSGTSRIVFRNIGIPHSFTLEASFCGTILTKNNNENSKQQFYHFNTDDLKLMGETFCYSLLDFYDPDQTQIKQIIAKIKEDLTTKITQKLQNKGVVIDLNRVSSVMELDTEDISSGDDNGSDSSDSNGLPTHFQYIRNPKIKKKVKRKENKYIKENSKEDGFENKSILGSRCLTCFQLANSGPTPSKPQGEIKKKFVYLNENSKRKFKSPSPKHDCRNFDEKEKAVILPRCFANNLLKKISPNLHEECFKTTFHEMEISKIELPFPGVSRYKSENYYDILCPFHKSESLKEQERKCYPNSWKPAINIQESIYIQKPLKLKNLNHSKPGLPVNSFQIMGLSSSPIIDGKQKSSPYKSLNPIKRDSETLTLKKIPETSNENKESNKMLSAPDII